ncbi:MAG TPA: hypothetical protein VGF86_01605 [Candidatus Tumulicola sp.]|jgi:hypothetical protein
MNYAQPAGRRLLVFAMTLLLAGCLNARPSKWTLWYVPGQPKPGIVLSKTCQTYVFATPGQTEFAVAVAKGWVNPPSPDVRMYNGEDFTGTLELGSQTIHDESNGRDLNVDVIYKIRAYIPAKLRADSNCGLNQGDGTNPR